jgi:hypothetical protein
MALTIGETTQQLHRALRDYIEATYHVSHRTLVDQRGALLDQVGVIHQRPYLESTPRYKAGKKFADLGLPAAALDIFTAVSARKGDLGLLIHDPPYQHQALSTQLSLVEGQPRGDDRHRLGQDRVLPPADPRQARHRSQGEGEGVRRDQRRSGDGALPDERARQRSARTSPAAARRSAHRATLRRLVRPPRALRALHQPHALPGRSRQGEGPRSPEADREVLREGARTRRRSCLAGASGGRAPRRRAEEARQVAGEADLAAWYGKGRWLDKNGDFKRCVTLPDDPELVTRHEVHAAPPDVLVTNYSMLEYMLMRPLERPIFDRTREWLEKNPEERFLLVIDEAHLYRGAQGAEVALLSGACARGSASPRSACRSSARARASRTRTTPSSSARSSRARTRRSSARSRATSSSGPAPRRGRPPTPPRSTRSTSTTSTMPPTIPTA